MWRCGAAVSWNAAPAVKACLLCLMRIDPLRMQMAPSSSSAGAGEGGAGGGGGGQEEITREFDIDSLVMQYQGTSLLSSYLSLSRYWPVSSPCRRSFSFLPQPVLVYRKGRDFLGCTRTCVCVWCSYVSRFSRV